LPRALHGIEPDRVFIQPDPIFRALKRQPNSGPMLPANPGNVGYYLKFIWISISHWVLRLSDRNHKPRLAGRETTAKAVLFGKPLGVTSHPSGTGQTTSTIRYSETAKNPYHYFRTPVPFQGRA